MDPEQVKSKRGWTCEDCSRKTAQRRHEAHRDGPPTGQEKGHTSNQGSPEPTQSQPQPKDQDVVMRTAELGNQPATEDASDEEPVRGGAVARKRRVVSESQSQEDAKREGEAASAESADQSKPEGTPKKKGWKGYALVASDRGTPQPEVVTTPGGTRRTRSGKPFYLEDNGSVASEGERQRSMETN
jgi:hypothetical protein